MVGYRSDIHEKMTKNMNALYSDIDFAFHPIHDKEANMRHQMYYKPRIASNQTIFFRPESRLIDYLSLSSSLDFLSNMINKGSYEFMSLTRTMFVYPPHVSRISGGVRSKFQKTVQDYMSCFEPTSGVWMKRISRKQKVKLLKRHSQKRKKKGSKKSRKV